MASIKLAKYVVCRDVVLLFLTYARGNTVVPNVSFKYELHDPAICVPFDSRVGTASTAFSQSASSIFQGNKTSSVRIR